MRIIIVGIGAIGGTLAVALTDAGHHVIGVARGAQLRIIKHAGLLMRSPMGAKTAQFACATNPIEIDFRPDDMIVLATKTQDTAAVLADLATAGVTTQPIFCAQNGVENERLAQRRFPNVHGVAVMMPVDFLTPGEVAAYGAPHHGIFELGRYPSGTDDADTRFAEALKSANIAAFTAPDVMAGKYGKLLMNLNNIVDAAFGDKVDTTKIRAALRAEGEAVYKAAKISWRDTGNADPRRKTLMQIQPIANLTRTGSSSTQSLMRGAKSIETEYLNGEICLLGRLNGVPTPVNDYFCALATEMITDQIAPGTISPERVTKHLAL
ncbi:MAG: 2-dehydropantoate 2-reductase N-terminal domain-containing protein [Deltaproteobacteria bacterium]